MKIISKWKDYYDFNADIYGVDEKLILDRREWELPSFLQFPEEKPELYTIAICGKLYEFFRYKYDYYHTADDIYKLQEIIVNDGFKRLPSFGRSILWSWRKERISNKLYTLEEIKKKMDLQLKHPSNNTDFNKKVRQPYVLIHHRGCLHYEEYAYNMIKLDDFNFSKVIQPFDIYNRISNFMGWLVDNPPLPDTQENDDKIISAGFDIKKSFRHKK